MSTKIEWADEVWNPVTGCTKVSEGCRNCYAERMATRLRGRCGYPEDEPFDVMLHRDRLNKPLYWRKPRTIFVCSMGDLFHDDVPTDFIAAVFGVMSACQRHTFLVLTKRPDLMLSFLKYLTSNVDIEYTPERSANYKIIYYAALAGVTPPPVAHEHLDDGWQDRWPLPNVWLGVSVENQAAADERIPLLLQTPAAKRFVSCEPLLGPVDLEPWLQYPPFTPNYKMTFGYDDFRGLDWVIAGDESGPGRRESNLNWARSIRDQCQDAELPFFFKQWHTGGEKVTIPELDGRTWEQRP